MYFNEMSRGATRTLSVMAAAGTLFLANNSTAHADRNPNAPYADASCISPTLQERRAVRTMLAQPENPALVDLRTGVGKDVTDEAAKQKLEAAEEFKQDTAERLDVETHDASPAIDELYEYRQKPEVPTSRYLRVARKFLAHYDGVKLVVPKTDKGLLEGGRPLQAAELEGNRVKDTIISLMWALDDMPENYLKLTGTRSFNLIAGTEQNGVGAYVPHGKLSKNIYLSATPGYIALPPRTIQHELAHQVNEEQCSDIGRYNDNEFAKYNGKAANKSNMYYYETTPTNRMDSNQSHVSYEDYNALYGIKSTEIAEAEREGDVMRKCQLFAELDLFGRRVIAYSDYHPNQEEHRAEIMADIPNPDAYGIYNNPTGMTRFYRMFELLQARMYRQDPKLVEYFITISQRPTRDNRSDVCNTVATLTQARRPKASMANLNLQW